MTPSVGWIGAQMVIAPKTPSTAGAGARLRSRPAASAEPPASGSAVPAVADLGGTPAGAVDPAVLDPGFPGSLDRVGLLELGGRRPAGAGGQA